LSNFTDLDALAAEPRVSVRWVTHPAELGDPDLVVLPGTKATVADLGWLHDRGLGGAVASLLRSSRPPTVIGICGGFQMLGRSIVDESGVEADPGTTPGLGLLPLDTTFVPGKQTVRRSGRVAGTGVSVDGYEIHHGVARVDAGAAWWFELESAGGIEREGVADVERAVYGTSLHGVFEGDEFRGRLLAAVASRRGTVWCPSGVSFAAVRRAQFDRVADACETHLDLDGLWRIVGEGVLA
ncbi:MAG: cobyric acid synthase, partial [Acidimicrobiales bacterium]